MLKCGAALLLLPSATLHWVLTARPDRNRQAHKLCGLRHVVRLSELITSEHPSSLAFVGRDTQKTKTYTYTYMYV